MATVTKIFITWERKLINHMHLLCIFQLLPLKPRIEMNLNRCEIVILSRWYSSAVWPCMTTLTWKWSKLLFLDHFRVDLWNSPFISGIRTGAVLLSFLSTARGLDMGLFLNIVVKLSSYKDDNDGNLRKFENMILIL